MAEQQQGIKVQINDEELKGRYSNLLRITHTREEFILDFMNFVPPQAVVTARIIVAGQAQYLSLSCGLSES